MYYRRPNQAVSVLTDWLSRARPDFGKTSSCRAGTPEKSNIHNLQTGQEAASRLTESFDPDKMSGHPSPVRPSGCPDVNPLTEMRGSELKPNGGTDPTHTESASSPLPASRQPTTLDEWEPLIIGALRQRYSKENAKRVERRVTGLFGFLRVRGIEHLHDMTTELVVEWLRAPGKTHWGAHRRPAVSTVRNRRRNAEVAFEEAKALGAQIDPAELVGERIPRPAGDEYVRPLTDGEIDRGRIFADRGPITAGGSFVFALAEAGGQPSEMAAMRMRDIDLDAGTVTFFGPAARICPFNEWGLQMAKLFFGNVPPLAPDDLVCLAPQGARSSTPQGIEARLRRVLVAADLIDEPGVTVNSIRLASARKVFEAHGIEAAARFLGTPSLDTAARAVGHNWRQDNGSR